MGLLSLGRTGLVGVERHEGDAHGHRRSEALAYA